MTTKIALTPADLDTLLLEDDAQGRNEAIEMLQAHDDTARSNARELALGASEWALLQG